MNKIMNKMMKTLLFLSLFSTTLVSCDLGNFVSTSSEVENMSSTNVISQSSTATSSSEEVSKQKQIYLLAKASGYEGTYEEWLESIKGDSIELSVEDNAFKWKYTSSDEWITLISLEDLIGEKGEPGKDGTSFLNGAGAPSEDKGNVGDSYIDYSTWDFYVKNEEGWTKVGNMGATSTPTKDHDGTEGLVFYPINLKEYAVSVGNCFLLDEIIIPDKYKGCRVTTIIDSGFSGCENIETIKIPRSIKKIGDYAFEGCTNLKSIVIPSTVGNMGSYVFDNCPNLIVYTEFAIKPLTWSDNWAKGIKSYFKDKWSYVDGVPTCNIKYDDTVYEIQGYTFHNVGSSEILVDEQWIFNEWAAIDDNIMTPTSIYDVSLLDEDLAEKLSTKDIKGLYIGETRFGAYDTGWTFEVMKNNQKIVINGSFAFKVVRATYVEEDDIYLVEQWICDPMTAHAEALSDNIFIPPWQEDADENGFSWGYNVGCIGEAGVYKVVIAQYKDKSTATTPGYGIGLIYMEE